MICQGQQSMVLGVPRYRPANSLTETCSRMTNVSYSDNAESGLAQSFRQAVASGSPSRKQEDDSCVIGEILVRGSCVHGPRRHTVVLDVPGGTDADQLLEMGA